MIFTTLEFFIFFTVVISIYWKLQGLFVKQRFLLVASVIFYGWWDYRFLALVGTAILVAYFAALGMQARQRQKKALLVTAISLLLGILGVFKYANFFTENLNSLVTIFGMTAAPREFDITLPVGISFFTFQALSYVIDVYKGVLPAERRFDAVALYIIFFPQLVAGPIVRAENFLPQLQQEPKFNHREAAVGVKLFLIGFLYKAVFADSIAPVVDTVYGDVDAYDNYSLFMATLGFSAQIYFDFAGYSIMAIGIARMLGYKLPRNFNFPYVATSITEFWRRWHISLSSWLRDYLYIPLGGNRNGAFARNRNLMITMLLGGLWHRASWNFVVWGGLHGIALTLHKGFKYLCGRYRDLIPRGIPPLVWLMAAWAVTQMFVLLCWVPFRAQSFDDTLIIWQSMVGWREDVALQKAQLSTTMILLPLLVDTFLVSKRMRMPSRVINMVSNTSPMVLLMAFGVIFGLALLLVPLRVENFIYFQF